MYTNLFGGSGCSPHPLVAALPLPAVSLSDFLWAYGCVSSREFGVGPYRMLVPFADFANHSFQVGIRVEVCWSFQCVLHSGQLRGHRLVEFLHH